jgi:4-hydroxybenzoate polyprenyltransferase
MAAHKLADSQISDLTTPIAVDLDHTLVKTDTLYEGLAALLGSAPWKLAGIFWKWLAKGRAAGKARLTTACMPDIATLPLREDLVLWLTQQQSLGRPLHLVSAADTRIVTAMSQRMGIFTSAIGSVPGENLKGPRKAEKLAALFPGGFAYAGDSSADLAVWRRASSAIMAGSDSGVRSKLNAIGTPIEAVFPDQGSGLRKWISALRVHQWSKNLIVFIPLLLSQSLTHWDSLSACMLAFLAMCLASSSTYLLNDLLDLPADRLHATKKKRALASGAIKVRTALFVMPLGLAAAIGLAASINTLSLLTLLAYLALTLSYSFRLKRVPLLDTSALGLLFTLRVVIGVTASGIVFSPWLLAFSLMFFFGLAMAKRQTEIVKLGSRGGGSVAGRGYHAGDAMLTLVYGVCACLASLVVIMLYIASDSVGKRPYASPEWLWAVPLLMHFWLIRIWFYAHRGLLHDDPIVFALKDRISLAIGLACAAAVMLAI